MRACWRWSPPRTSPAASMRATRRSWRGPSPRRIGGASPSVPIRATRTSQASAAGPCPWRPARWSGSWPIRSAPRRRSPAMPGTGSPTSRCTGRSPTWPRGSPRSRRRSRGPCGRSTRIWPSSPSPARSRLPRANAAAGGLPGDLRGSRLRRGGPAHRAGAARGRPGGCGGGRPPGRGHGPRGRDPRRLGASAAHADPFDLRPRRFPPCGRTRPACPGGV